MALHKSWVFFFSAYICESPNFLAVVPFVATYYESKLGASFQDPVVLSNSKAWSQLQTRHCFGGNKAYQPKLFFFFFFGSGADLIATHIFVASQPLVSEKKKTQLFRFLQKVLSQIALFSSYAVQHVSLSDARVADWFLFFFKEHTRLFNRKPHLFFVYTHTVCGCTWVCLYMCIYIF